MRAVMEEMVKRGCEHRWGINGVVSVTRVLQRESAGRCSHVTVLPATVHAPIQFHKMHMNYQRESYMQALSDEKSPHSLANLKDRGTEAVHVYSSMFYHHPATIRTAMHALCNFSNSIAEPGNMTRRWN